jgi:glyoxylase-like metal-dependent hydrolase (beta-lactamase superfamily II)
MRVLRLQPGNPRDYCGHVYWVLGTASRPGDVNTLVDAGSAHPDNLAYYLGAMERTSKGIGRRPVDQIVLTHGHYDHTGGLPALARAFDPAVLAFRPEPGAGRALRDGEWLRMGDEDFRVLHTPGHSEDSICLFSPVSGTLFSGDTLYRITDAEGAYPACYLGSLERLLALGATTVHPGHGEPVTGDVGAFIRGLIANVRTSRSQD